MPPHRPVRCGGPAAAGKGHQRCQEASEARQAMRQWKRRASQGSERRHKRDSTPTQENQALAHADHSRDANRLGLFSTNARRERQQLASVLLPAVDATCNKNERKTTKSTKKPDELRPIASRAESLPASTIPALTSTSDIILSRSGSGNAGRTLLGNSLVTTRANDVVTHLRFHAFFLNRFLLLRSSLNRFGSVLARGKSIFMFAFDSAS